MIADKGTIPKVQYEQSFKVKSDDLKSISKNADILKTDEILLVGRNQVLTLQTGDDDKIRDKIKVPEIQEEFSVKFGESLFNIINVLDGEVIMSCKTDYPIKVINKNEFMEFIFICAPRIENV